MRDLLPHPQRIEEIQTLFSPILSEYGEEIWKGKFEQDDIISTFKFPHPPFKVSSNSYKEFNLYLLYRAMNQVGEACNKLWTTIEVYYHMRHESSDVLIKDFNRGFLPTSTVPTLYYADISAMISILSCFGVGSMIDKKEGLKFHNLVRTKKGFILIERDKYLKKVFGVKERRWHSQVFKMYKGFPKKGIELPNIDIDAVKELMNDRNFFDYDLLGQTSMRGAFGEDIYFEHLPHVVKTVQTAIEVLHKIIEPFPNKCDVRFEALLLRLPSFYAKWRKKYPL